MEELKKEITSPEIRCISFDLFGTLVTPIVTSQNDIFSIISEERDDLPDNFLSVARRNSTSLKGALDSFRKNWKWSDEKIQSIRDSYVDAEIRYCVRRESIGNLFELAKNSNKLVFVNSDTHLTKQEITRILDANGYSGYSEIISSYEDHCCKYDGSSFGRIISDSAKRFNVELKPENILHIDDYDHVSRVAADMGCVSVHISIPSQLSKDFKSLDSLKNSLNILDRVLAGYLIAKLFNDPFAENHGIKNLTSDQIASLLTPILFGFSNEVSAKVESDNISRILLLSRDGYLVGKLLDILSKTKAEHRPFYASRYSRIPLLYSCGEHGPQDLPTQYVLEYTTVQDYLLTHLCIEDGSKKYSEAISLLEEHGFHKTTRVDLNNGRLASVLKKLLSQDAIEKRALECLEYLESSVDSHTLVIDFGRRGSIAQYLDRFIDSRACVCQMIASSSGFAQIGKVKLQNYICDNGQKDPKVYSLLETVLKECVPKTYYAGTGNIGYVHTDLSRSFNVNIVKLQETVMRNVEQLAWLISPMLRRSIMNPQLFWDAYCEIVTSHSFTLSEPDECPDRIAYVRRFADERNLGAMFRLVKYLMENKNNAEARIYYRSLLQKYSGSYEDLLPLAARFGDSEDITFFKEHRVRNGLRLSKHCIADLCSLNKDTFLEKINCLGIAGDVLSKVFSRGYVLSEREIPVLDCWKREKLSFSGKTMNLYHDGLQIALADSGGVDCCILGIIFDTDNPKQSNKDISKNLCKLYSRSEEDFHEYLDVLAGSFLVIIGNSGNIRIYGDATCSKCCHVSVSDGLVSSHGSLIRLINHSKTLEIHSIWSRMPNKPYSMPANFSQYEGIMELIPNHYAEYPDWEQVRFWPRKELERSDFKKYLDTVHRVLDSELKYLTDNYHCVSTLTAGKDSRICLTSMKDFRDKIDFFIRRKPKSQCDGPLLKDVELSKELSKEFGLKFKEIETMWNDDDLKIAKFIHFHIPAPVPNDTKRYWPRMQVSFRHNIIEIARQKLFYEPKDDSTLIDNLLSWSGWAGCKEARELFEGSEYAKYSEEVNKGYPTNLLFYWEYRVAFWVNVPITLNDNHYSDNILLFNCRKLLDLGLRLRMEDAHDFPHDYIEKYWPELLRVPFN